MEKLLKILGPTLRLSTENSAGAMRATFQLYALSAQSRVDIYWCKCKKYKQFHSALII